MTSKSNVVIITRWRFNNKLQCAGNAILLLCMRVLESVFN